MQTHIPESVFSLTFCKSINHLSVRINKFVFVRTILRKKIHCPDKRCQNPSVSPRPVAILSIWLLIRGNEILIAPPELIGSTVKAVCSMLKFCEHIHIVHSFEVPVILIYSSKSGIYG